MNRTWIKSLAFLAVLALCAGIAAAGCGEKTTHEGTLKSVDSENKTVVVDVDGTEVRLTLTDGTEVTDAEGNAVDASSLVGKSVKVVSEHAEIDSIAQTA